jgi:hypothetical protein
MQISVDLRCEQVVCLITEKKKEHTDYFCAKFMKFEFFYEKYFK